ncbi:hypothetical protein ADK70_14705 [Streptomyces rimosus subsp. pseudoverticillatus]|nr:hypothetical protein ADK70_14705 [Streptomyces rimosus subsp. pseudoverticillatus]
MYGTAEGAGDTLLSAMWGRGQMARVEGRFEGRRLGSWGGAWGHGAWARRMGRGCGIGRVTGLYTTRR